MNKKTTSCRFNYTDFNTINKSKLVELIDEWTFGVELNANDTFAYVCADSTFVDSTDLWKLVEVYEKFGNPGVLAFQAHIRKEEPLKELITDKYKEARKYLKNFIPFEDQ